MSTEGTTILEGDRKRRRVDAGRDKDWDGSGAATTACDAVEGATSAGTAAAPAAVPGSAAAASANGQATSGEPELTATPPARPPPTAPPPPPQEDGYRQPSGAYSQREEYLIKQEADGELAYHYVLNNGEPHNMIRLTGLKNIFSKQLPNMPREYICRLIFDRRHRSVALVRRNGTVLGGITYRVFADQALGEIAFCAVTANEQVKGFGTRLMNNAKEAARSRDQLRYFLTYADNNAVGYFQKQGFTKEISLPRDKWAGLIKDYDGGTLMEYVLHPKLPYANLPTMVRAQKEALDNQLRGLSNSHVVHAGLEHFVLQDAGLPEPPRTASWQLERPVPTPIPISDIPGVLAAGWQPDHTEPPRLLPEAGAGATGTARDALAHVMDRALTAVVGHEDAWPFRQPVDVTMVPDYLDLIKDPVDLTLIRYRLSSGHYYHGLDMFLADFRRMFNNCRYYNSSETPYYRAANKLEGFLEDFLSRLCQEV